MAHRFTLPKTLAAAGLMASLVACGDDPTRPDGFLDAAEAEVVIRSAAALPALPELLAYAAPGEPGRSAAFVRIQELWDAGTAADGPYGALQRQRAAVEVAPLISHLIAPEDWADVRDRLEQWVGTADRMLQQLDMPAVGARLATARRHLDGADAAATDEARTYHLVMAMAELVETTPRYVARTMVREAESAVRAAEAAMVAGPAERSLDRARRLADWAATAADEGDHLRAIQRAYYARQLVEDR